MDVSFVGGPLPQRGLERKEHEESAAEGDGRPPVSEDVPEGTWKPRPGPANDFGYALARRYSGSFRDSAGRTVPRVRYFQFFNEPNMEGELTPQWEGNRPTGALMYRRLLNAFYRGIKSVDRSNVVVAGGAEERLERVRHG
jgi:hypothetical protein